MNQHADDSSHVVQDGMETNDKYSKILDLPHHVSKNHRPMSRLQRAAQFAPFAALTGHGAALMETARWTDSQVELSDSEKKVLDQKMAILLSRIKEMPEVVVTYFVPDLQKEGGRYATVSGKVRKWNAQAQILTLDDETEIRLQSIVDIDSPLFNSASCHAGGESQSVL